MQKRANYIVGFITPKMKYCDVFILRNATEKQADHVQDVLDTRYAPLAFYCNLKSSVEPKSMPKMERQLDKDLK